MSRLTNLSANGKSWLPLAALTCPPVRLPVLLAFSERHLIMQDGRQAMMRPQKTQHALKTQNMRKT